MEVRLPDRATAELEVAAVLGERFDPLQFGRQGVAATQRVGVPLTLCFCDVHDCRRPRRYDFTMWVAALDYLIGTHGAGDVFGALNAAAWAWTVAPIF